MVPAWVYNRIYWKLLDLLYNAGTTAAREGYQIIIKKYRVLQRLVAINSTLTGTRQDGIALNCIKMQVTELKNKVTAID